ncbi:Rho GDP-dissociation inhibitor 2 [Holothuria leucospilota]|uniref:Rho GDP-dissociation inhibitor 2 n=1 Tax=Holothuria leucospilota TaxID=206669 RepID=A0A9Q1C3B7_HOLLE|nr:Rho GDP-dissociation inhibitor 2 [Holothuria leucospilota]
MLLHCHSAMAETENDPKVEGDEEDTLETPGYKPPAQKTLEEIQNADADDESLVRYKQQLLGSLPAATEQMRNLRNGQTLKRYSLKTVKIFKQLQWICHQGILICHCWV